MSRLCLSWPLLPPRSEEHTSELQSPGDLVCRLLLEKKNKSKIVDVLQQVSAHDTIARGRGRRLYLVLTRPCRRCELRAFHVGLPSGFFCFLNNPGPREISPFPIPAPFPF